MQHGCGSGSGSGTCSCAGAAASSGVDQATGSGRAAAESGDAQLDAMVAAFNATAANYLPPTPRGEVASVNGVGLHAAGDRPDAETLRQRAYSELLRQEAIQQGLLDADDIASDAGAQSEAATAAIEALLEQALVVPQPDEVTCRRYYEQNGHVFRAGERVSLRHILFAVTPGVDVAQLRRRAEAALLDARCRPDNVEDRFPSLARDLSNCPSGAQGGDLGWLQAHDCAPEFAREVFDKTEVGVLPRLVHSRFGLHVVEVLAREPGTLLPYECARGAVAQILHQQSYVAAVRQYLQMLAGAADIRGLDLAAADSPLVQ